MLFPDLLIQSRVCTSSPAPHNTFSPAFQRNSAKPTPSPAMNAFRRLRAVRVHQVASRQLEAGRLKDEPAWYRVVAAIPPTTSLVRTLPVQQKDHKPWKKTHRPRGLFMPQKIVYPEDRLRAQFYKDHPWELARPRILVENDGADSKAWDWSTMRQRGKGLDGER